MRTEPTNSRVSPAEAFPLRIFRRRSANLLVIAALVCRLPWSWPAVAQSMSTNEQMDIADSQFDYPTIEASREYVENLADNLKTTADGLKLFYDLRDLKPYSNTSQADLSFFRKIAPTQDLLSRIEAEKADHFALLEKIYDVADSLRNDLQRTPPAHSNRAMVVLSSDSFAKLDSMTISWLASDKVLSGLVQNRLASKSFRRYAGVVSAGAEDLLFAVKEISANGLQDPDGVSDLAKAATEAGRAAISKGFLPRSITKPLSAWTLGADDVAAGVARGLASGNWRDPETAARLLDGINRSTFGAVGYLVSDGNPKVAQWFSDTADFTAKTVRARTQQIFLDGMMSGGGYDQAIREQFETAQSARAAHGAPLLTIEQYAHNDPAILHALGASAQEVARARASAQAAAEPLNRVPTEVVTHTFTDSYHVSCLAGVCTRVSLITATATPGKVGGVRINPDLKRVKGTIGSVGIPSSGCSASINALCSHP